LYIGITGSLSRRISQHKSGQYAGFTQKYKVNKLIYLEQYNTAKDAILREKQIKKWSRKKKNQLISESNPLWEEVFIW
jgi:putative endonuclease